MMEDRELLELAAKAYGARIEIPDDKDGVFVVREKDRNGFVWNPLKDDGDALRLAIILDIHIKRYAGATTAHEWVACFPVTEHDHWSINDNDRMKSTRRAIVRAAAEIGKSIP